VTSPLRLILTLSVIALAASLGLAAAYNATHAIAEAYRQKEADLARVDALGCDPDAFFVMTETDSVVSRKPFVYYTAHPSEGSDEVIGYTFTAYGKGYSSVIETIVGVDPAGKVTGSRVTYQQETPGLGTKILEVLSKNTLWDVLSGRAVKEEGVKPWFQEQLVGRGPDDLQVVKSKSEPGVLAITGATISSDAVTSSIRAGLRMLLSIVGTGGQATETIADAPAAAVGETE
jgi:electron transport complex protein RnfG